MLIYGIVALSALSLAGLVWCAVAGVRVRAGWQNGDSPLARWLDARRRARFEAQLPDALATMSNALRAGFSLAQAFDSVAETHESPIRDEFTILQQQLRLGMGFEQALASMDGRVGSEELSLVTTAMLVSRKTGGNVTEIFDRIAETVRARMRIARKVRALTAQGRMQGLIVSAMPLVLGAILTLVKPGLMIPFLFSWVGLAAVCLVLALVLLGWLFIRRIIRIDV